MPTPRPALAAVLLALAAAAILSFRPIYEPDLWWHLAQGREDVAGRLVRTNLFSFTHPDYRQHYTPWLFDSAVYLAWRGLGPVGIQLFQASCLWIALVVLFIACRVRGAPGWSAAVVLAIGFFILEPRAIPRPHLVSFAAMAGCTLLIEQAVARRRAAPLAWAVPLVALWSNFHVECVFGAGLLGLFALAETVRPSALSRADALRALALAALAGLATLANPYGWGVLAYLYENLSVPRLLAIAELLPPPLAAYRAFYAYLVLVAVMLLARPRRLALWEAAVAVTFGVFGAMHLRETPLILLATAPMVAGRLALVTAPRIDPRAVVITGVCAALALSRIPLRLLATEIAAGREAVEPAAFFSPAAIGVAERAGLGGPVFTSHNLGGYLAWTMYPDVRIFQDGRLQAYPPDFFPSIIAASRAQADWSALVAEVDWAVVSVPRPNQMSGAGRFPASEWRSVYQDEAMEIVVRRNGRFGGVTAGR